MRTIKLKIKDKEYEVLVALTEEEKEQGLQDVEEMSENEGMLFVYDEPQILSFWMHNTEIPLDIIFIDEDWIVRYVSQGEPMDEKTISCSDVQYVLELNQNSGVKEGDEIEVDDEELNPGKDLTSKYLNVYGPDGQIQAQLVGGERIMSIKNVKTLVRMARKAYTTKNDSDYKRLGKKLFEYLKVQDNNEPEYVEGKKEKEDA